MRQAQRERSLLLILMLASVTVLLGVELRQQDLRWSGQAEGWADAPVSEPVFRMSASEPGRMISRIRPITDERPLSF